MSDEVRALVDRRWDEYAVPGTPSGSAVQNAPRPPLATAVTSLTRPSAPGLNPAGEPSE